jgi:hypothetical protein
VALQSKQRHIFSAKIQNRNQKMGKVYQKIIRIIETISAVQTIVKNA